MISTQLLRYNACRRPLLLLFYRALNSRTARVLMLTFCRMNTPNLKSVTGTNNFTRVAEVFETAITVLCRIAE